MNNIKSRWLLVPFFFLTISLFAQERSFSEKRELFAQLSLVQEGKTVWAQDEKHSFLPGRPVQLQIKSNKIVAIISITLYPKIEGLWFIAAQAQVARLDSEFRASQWYQVRKSFPLKEGGKLFFYPFRNTALQKGLSSSGELQLLLSLSPVISE